jgi:hypothetical protein
MIASPAHSYRVLVDDNFHHMDDRERWTLGTFASCEEALAACRRLLDAWLREAWETGMTAEPLYAKYTRFGEDPFIQPSDGARPCGFSDADLSVLKVELLE